MRGDFIFCFIMIGWYYYCCYFFIKDVCEISVFVGCTGNCVFRYMCVGDSIFVYENGYIFGSLRVFFV